MCRRDTTRQSRRLHILVHWLGSFINHEEWQFCIPFYFEYHQLSRFLTLGPTAIRPAWFLTVAQPFPISPSSPPSCLLSLVPICSGFLLSYLPSPPSFQDNFESGPSCKFFPHRMKQTYDIEQCKIVIDLKHFNILSLLILSNFMST